jgi:carbonic anhydrase
MAVEANVRWSSMRQIMDTPEAEKSMKEGATLVGTIYGIDSGRVRFLTSNGDRRIN